MKASPRVLTIATGLAGAMALAALTAWGQALSSRPILHLDVPPPDLGAAGVDPSNAAQPIFGPAPGEGQNPAAFAYGSKILPAPERGPEPAESEPVHGRGGFAVDRQTQATPDTHTGADDALQYVTVFNPSVLPFKRMSALDSVRADYTLFVAANTQTKDLTVGGTPSRHRDLFWGDLVVALQPGVDVAIPSVAPDMRILSYETEPRIAVTFSKDGSDNYFVRTDESGANGTYRLRFMVDAAVTYFAPEVPRQLRVRDVAAQAPPGLLKPIPAEIRPDVERALERLELSEGMRLQSALNTLVGYFRSFEAKDIIRQSGNVYWDLFSSQAGVCRHRAFVFMVTANGLGIPTRYVTNEAHAWVEVWIPEVNWIRIDLGGAALRMEVDNASGKSLYQPRGDDPFVQPPKYANNYTQLEGDIQGLSNDQIAERQQPARRADGTSNSFNPGAPAANNDASEPIIGPGEDLPQLPSDQIANKRPVSLRITEVDPEGFRGESVQIAGQLVRDDGTGVEGITVVLLMAPAGLGGKNAQVVGRTVTRQDGSFENSVELPVELIPQDYEVYASTPGNAQYAPSVSQ